MSSTASSRASFGSRPSGSTGAAVTGSARSRSAGGRVAFPGGRMNNVAYLGERRSHRAPAQRSGVASHNTSPPYLRGEGVPRPAWLEGVPVFHLSPGGALSESWCWEGEAPAEPHEYRLGGSLA